MKSKRDKASGSAPEDRNEKRKSADTESRAEGKLTTDKKLPGEYPAKEDIYNRLNTQRVGMDVENFSRAIGPENFNVKEPAVTNPDSIEDDPGLRGEGVEDRRDRGSMEHPSAREVNNEDRDENSESDVTEEDLEALGPKDLSMDGGDDEKLKNRVWPVDMAADDLDVPGSELDDRNEAIGSEDEENNSYSLGGDNHDDEVEGK